MIAIVFEKCFRRDDLECVAMMWFDEILGEQGGFEKKDDDVIEIKRTLRWLFVPHYLTHTTGSYSPGDQDKNLLKLNFLTKKDFSDEEIV